MDIELELFNFLIEGFLIDNDFVAVDQVLFELMRQNAFDRVDFVGLTYLPNEFSNFRIGVARFDESEGCLDCLISCKDGISLFPFDLSFGVALDDESMCYESRISVDMSSQFDFECVTLFD